MASFGSFQDFFEGFIKEALEKHGIPASPAAVKVVGDIMVAAWKRGHLITALQAVDKATDLLHRLL